MRLITKAYTNEQKQFLKLSKQGQKLLLSIFLYNWTHPVFSIFINAFIWRQSHDLTTVALYNLATFSMVPVGFYINGYILRRVSIKRLYFAGALFRALCLLLLVFTPRVTELSIIIFGLSFGLLSGIFWSNRNLLTVKLTNTTNRIYFTTLDYISLTVSNILVPLLSGAFIVFGSNHSLYTPLQGYYVVIILTILITVLLSAIIKKIHATQPAVPNIVHRKATFQWNCARGVVGLFGLMNGVFAFFPALLVLNYMGKEDTLGIIQSIAAVLGGLLLYAIARTINNKYRITMIAVSIVTSFIGSLIMAINFTVVSMFLFIALFTLATQLLYTVAYAVVWDLIDRENTDGDKRYGYVFDMELFLNVGRVVGIVLFLLYIHLFTNDFALRFTPVIFGFFQFVLIYLAYIIEDKKAAAANPELAPASVNE